MAKPSDDQAQQLACNFIKKSIDEMGSFYNPVVAGPDQGDDTIPLICNRQDLEGCLGVMSGIRDDLVLALSKGDFSMLEKAIGDLFRENGINEVDKQSLALPKGGIINIISSAHIL